jgi:hypothetical protein
MGLKRSASVCRLLHVHRTASNDDLLNRSPWGFGRFHCREGGSSIAGVSVAGAATANLFGFSSSLRRKQKVKPFVEVDREKR